MFTFYNQLSILLWKNFRLGRRQPSSFIFQIITPLFIIFIVIAVRKVTYKFQMDSCELREKQMASLGPIPFLKDFICTINTTCYNKTQIDWSGQYVNQFIIFLNNITIVYNSLPKDNPTFQDFLNWYLNHNDKVLILSYSLKYVSNEMVQLLNAFTQLESGNKTEILLGLQTLETSICGSAENDASIFINVFYKLTKTKRSVQICQEILSKMLSNSTSGKQLYDVISPLIFGKIYYYPDSGFTRELMKRANTTFKILDDLRLSAVEWRLNFREWFLNYTENSDIINKVREYCNNPISVLFCEIINPLLEPKSVILMEKAISSIFTLIESALNCTELDKFVPLSSSSDIDNLANQPMENIFAAITLNENLQYATVKNVTFLNYQIRMPTNRIDSTIKFKVLDVFWTPIPRTSTFNDLKYYTSGFHLLQEAVDHAFIEMVTGNISVNVGSSMQIMPYPCYVNDRFITIISNMMPFWLIIAWVSSFTWLIKSIVYEKENRLKEFMQVMGLANFVHWIGWFVSTLIVLIIPIIAMTLLLKYNKILEYSSPSIIFLLIMSYIISFICQAFMLSVFFNKANVASVAGGIIYFVFYLPFLVFVNLQDVITEEMYYVAGLLTQVAFCNSINFVAFWEQSTEGVQYSNLFESSILNLNVGVGHCMIMMWVDSVIYLIITWYVESVFPGEFGIAKPWYFLFTIQYWCPNRAANLKGKETYVHYKFEFPNDEEHGFEKEPDDLEIGISIRNLVKIYSKSKTPAVNDLNLNFYKSQITGFLGHNGAGKTTTISILTGIFSPTSGTAFIMNQDVRTQMSSIRKKMGLCPQHNILFGKLTVEDHIYFYGLLKGMNKHEIKEMLPKIVQNVGLTKKLNTPSNKLSGGMKRKLSVAMAFIGDSRVVFLDEPTAGVDPCARRGIWDLLMKYRDKNRTIILTTHHMDEADYLSDRIAIISQGKLQCCGSSVFLKKIFGEGYYLILVKNPTMHEEKFEENIFSKSGNNVLEFIKNYIPNAKMIEETKTQWTVILPQNDYNCLNFSKLFVELDIHMKILNIDNYGLSDTSLEEVFLKVADDPAGISSNMKEKIISPDKLDSLTDNGDLPRVSSVLSLRYKSEISDAELSFEMKETPKILNGYSLLFQQIIGLQIKRFHFTKRNVKGFFAEVILPILMIILMILMVKISSPFDKQPSMTISPWLMMPKGRIVNLNTFYRKENISNPQIDNLVEGYRSNLGESGVRCMNSSVYKLENYPCYYSNNDNKWSPLPESPIPMISPECDCSRTGYQVCSDPRSGGPPSSFKIMPSSDKLANLTGYNISDYLIKSFKKSIKKQYGGFQFLLPSEFGLSSKLIGELPFWDGIRSSINLSQSNNSNLETLKFLDYFQEFFNLSGTKTHFSRIWINTKGYASLPAYTNILSNLILRSQLNSSDQAPNYGITVANYPLKYTQSDLLDQLNKQFFLEVSLAIFVIFGLSFIPASFVIFLIEERVTGSKRQQFVSGVNPYVYWFSNFSWDIVKYLISVSFVLLIFLAFNYQSYIGSKNIGAFIIILVCYGFAIIPHMYPFSFIISTPSTAFVILDAYNLLVGSITTLATFILDLLEQDDITLKPVNDILKKVFLVFPQYDLGRGMMDLSFNFIKYNISNGDPKLNYNSFEWDTTGEKICSLLILSFAWWVIICIVESGIIHRSLCGKLKNFNLKKREISWEEDLDVSKERERLMMNNENDDILKVLNLTKIYNASLNVPIKCCKKAINDSLAKEKRKLAVNNLCFGVKEGECFGLLGVNGAGKTTTFKMLTGEESITHGNALINSYSIIRDMISAHKNMGFCPQFDALHSLLTCEEQLYFYCRIRGIEPSEIKSNVEVSIKNLSLMPHSTKLTQTLSGGNKRKLSTAIALIGLPKIIFLDEPTSGMDAGARRFLWNVIQKITNENKISVILTSHNMEECEVLCHRLSIMVNGEMKCLGSVQHLKSKFGDDYYVKIRMCFGEDIRNNIKVKIEEEFPDGVSLKDENFVMLQYRFDSSSKLSIIFEFFENLKSVGMILDYSVSQTTLDDVFISLANEASPESEEITNQYSSLNRNGYINSSFEKETLCVA